LVILAGARIKILMKHAGAGDRDRLNVPIAKPETLLGATAYASPIFLANWFHVLNGDSDQIRGYAGIAAAGRLHSQRKRPAVHGRAGEWMKREAMP